jgi:aspartyl-tRNA(Asn)/glutamyl-tRNA(Gln) amidotransferase subunit A
MQAAFDDLGMSTKKAGWAWNTLPLPPSFADVPRFHHAVMAVEAATYHSDRMRRYPDDYPPRVRDLINHGLSWSGPDYARVMGHCSALREEIEERFVDSWKTFITPATVDAAPTSETTGSPVFNSPWSYAGLPTVSLPFAWSADAMPLGVQLVGQKWCEDDLLAVAAMLEADIRFERRPLPL